MRVILTLGFLSLFIILIITCSAIVSNPIAHSTVQARECIKYAPPTPTPTPIPLSHIYTEWIPMPGTAPGTGHGWIRATELRQATSTWPPRDILTSHVLRDIEYGVIEEEHGLAMTQGGKMGYGFPPIQGFPRLYGGVILKNEWLPERLQ